MHFRHQGKSLWYGTPDAPAPEGVVQAGDGVSVTIGVKPADPSNVVEVRYRVDHGSRGTVIAKRLRKNVAQQAEYFVADLPPFGSDDAVEYSVICRCAGRQVPSAEEAARSASSFRIAGAQADLKPSIRSKEALLAQPSSGMGYYAGSGTAVRPATPPKAPLLKQAPASAFATPPQIGREPPAAEAARDVVVHQVIGRLLNQETSAPLAGFTVHAFDPDPGPEPKDLGYHITNGKGKFYLLHTMAREASTGKRGEAGFSLRLHILDLQGIQIHQTEARVGPDDPQPLEIRVPSARPTTARSRAIVQARAGPSRATSRLRKPTQENGPPGGDHEPPPTIKITSPTNDAVLLGPQNGEAITITGTVQDLPPEIPLGAVHVQIGRAYLGRATVTGETWIITGHADAHPGDQQISATTRVGRWDLTDKITVNIPDSVPPELTIIPPEVPNTDLNAIIDLKVDAFDPLGVQSVNANLDDGTSYRELTRDPSSAWRWTAQLWLPPTPLGNRTIIVRGTDLAGNQTERSVTIRVIDGTPPRYLILEPTEGQKILLEPTKTVVNVTVTGGAWDIQSGMVGGEAAVEWSLNGGPPFSRAGTANDWADWQTTVPISEYGDQFIYLRFTDRDGNSTTTQLRVQVVSSFPKDVEDRLSPRAYLEALLAYASQHVTVPPQEPLSTEKLREVFYQPFGKLAQPNFEAAGNQAVNELRVAIEVLHRYVAQIALDPASADALADAASLYRQTAYEALLTNIGTSYEEIRLARGAPEKERRSLADRLVIEPVHLNELLLEPTGVTNEALERIFGFVDTTRDPLQPSAAGPAFFDWQAAHLRTLWIQQDFADQHGTLAPLPIVEPDLIGRDDIRQDFSPNLALDLWVARTAWVQGERATVVSQRTGASNRLEEFDQVVAYGLGAPGKLEELESKRQQGQNIDADLTGLYLTVQTFDYLLRKRHLASTGMVTDTEWDDVYDILLQIRKRYQWSAWRDEERQKAITLSPQFFKIAGEERSLPAWRATNDSRRDWLDVLESRISQQDALANALQSSVAAAEQSALPLLRDALVVAAGKSGDTDGTAFGLSERLLIDVEGSGAEKTTRVLQAIGTVQALLFSLRIQRFEPNHPAFSWRLTPLDSENVEAHFDKEWKWLGTYATWRAAMLFFLYPENILWPQLRDNQTPAFRKLVNDLRIIRNLSAERARNAANRYLGYWIEGMDYVSKPSLIAAWKLDEGSGSVAADTSGNHNDGTLANGPVWEHGALGFRGQLDYVKVNNAPILQVGMDGSDFSVTFSLFLRQGATGQWRSIMHKGDEDFDRTFALWMHKDDDRVYYRISTARNVDEGGTSLWPIALNFWTPIAYVKQGQELRLYINGRLDSFVQLSDNSRHNSGSLYIGAYDRLTAKYSSVNGALKDIRIYNKALTSEAVEALAAPPPNEKLSAQDLESRRNQIQSIYALNPGGYWRNWGVVLSEVLYYLPIYLALQLQRSSNYLAALDWFQTVYAYNLPTEQRAIFYPLQWEQNGAPDLLQGPHWLAGSLDPHMIAGMRAMSGSNPYTRFTLMSVARCFSEYADAEFTRDTAESIAKARSLYMSARRLLADPALATPAATSPETAVLPNPALEALRAHVELQLSKLHQGRNIAGFKRQIELIESPAVSTGAPAIGPGGELVLPGLGALRPTPYRYSVVIDRAKQLVTIAQQIEAEYLATLEKYDVESYKRLQANQALDLAGAQLKLQDLRVQEAEQGIAVARKQKDRSVAQVNGYRSMINEGLNHYENEMLNDYANISAYRNTLAGIDAALTVTQTMVTASSGGLLSFAFGAGPVAAVGLLAGAKASFTVATNEAENSLQINTLRASQERREQEWRFQQSIAEQDVLIGEEQIKLAEDHVLVTNQERAIAQKQAAQARAAVDFLDNQFTGPDLYDWMSGVLAGVYAYFLEQATAMARLAQTQLAFERQEVPTAFIRSDYWQTPEAGAAQTTTQTPDRRGLTGAERLLQDIFQLDQYAFETNKRKLQLSQTFSLSSLFPFEFQQFRETGLLTFATPMDLFDRGFPGHYLRLIRKVRASLVALIPPNQGIRAALIASGVSRVTIEADGTFPTIAVRRDPELIALTSPINATGLFEMDVQSELLLPFEAMGVDTLWELELPRPANPFDYSTIADVLITIDYTALNSFDYRQRVLRKRDPKVLAERPFSFRNQLPDGWYDLHNPDQVDDQRRMVVTFTTSRADFPSNLEDLHIAQVVLYFVRASGESFEVPVKYLNFTLEGRPPVGGEAMSIGGVISTRKGNAANWIQMIGLTPCGVWELALPTEVEDLFMDEKIEDILFVLTYSGRTPDWPA